MSMERTPKSENKNPNEVNKIPTAVASSSAPSPPPPPPPQWIEMPRDIMANILQRLCAIEILERAQKVCTTWRRVCQDPAMWRVIHIRDPAGEGDDENRHLCRLAVDRSQGQLVDFSFEYFGDDELLNYVVDRSSQLKRLTLFSCDEYFMTGKALVEAVKKIPHLEELHLVIMPSVEAADIETIGISCPMLKSFTFNDHGCERPDTEYFSEDEEFIPGQNSNAYALAIAKSMPNLRHLRLFAHWMQNKGLEAILDGCPYLESLDLRQCFYLNLQGDLFDRCFDQIKDLKLPYDSVSDIEWLDSESTKWWYAKKLSNGYFYDDYGPYDDYDGYSLPFPY